MWNAFQGEEHRPFRLEGGKPAALLVHGFPGTPAEMRPLAESLHAAGWSAQGILLPGFGADISTMPYRRADEWLRAVRTAFDDLQRAHDPVIIIGNSMGSALALAVAAEAQRPPAGLVLLSPFWKIDHVLWTVLPVVKLVFPRFKPFSLNEPDFSDPETRKGIRNFMPDADIDDPETQRMIRDLEIPTNVLDQIRAVGGQAYRLAPRVTAPALVLQGTDDDLARPANTRRLRSRLQTCDYHEVASGHNLLNPAHVTWPTVQEYVLHFAKHCDAAL